MIGSKSIAFVIQDADGRKRVTLDVKPKKEVAEPEILSRRVIS